MMISLYSMPKKLKNLFTWGDLHIYIYIKNLYIYIYIYKNNSIYIIYIERTFVLEPEVLYRFYKGTKLSESKRLTIYVLLHPKSSPSKQILQNFNLWDFHGFPGICLLGVLFG